MICLKSKLKVSSLIERISPEVTTTALDAAIRFNRVDILETLLGQDKPENENRFPKREALLTKFDTGEVSNMAFGVKVRKVNIMRGNR